VGCYIGDAPVSSGGTGFNGAGILELNYVTSRFGASSWQLGSVYYGGDGGSRINKILTQSTGSGYEIYGCGQVSASGDNTTVNPTNASGDAITLTLTNKDIWVLKMNNTMTSVASDQYNKSNVFVAAGTDLTYMSSYQYAETGPLSARNVDGSGFIPWLNPATGSTITSPATFYLNFANNTNEGASDMTFTSDGEIAVISLVNIIGANTRNIGNTNDSVVLSATGAGLRRNLMSTRTAMLS